ncbi:helix-turn-helix domain-containing protein [Streptomyces sp. NPDC048710]|uniref:helix-turn-helix domain-containing protein n=1 Tax=Streptomyces sp. NPDC048710 TaxID=3365586 RepID=UPI0037198C7F
MRGRWRCSPGYPRTRRGTAPTWPRSPASPATRKTLDAYCATGSLRRAADLLHLHHGSVARRPEEIVRTLGVQLAEPTALFRDRPALIAWRLFED